MTPSQVIIFLMFGVGMVSLPAIAVGLWTLVVILIRERREVKSTVEISREDSRTARDRAELIEQKVESLKQVVAERTGGNLGPLAIAASLLFLGGALNYAAFESVSTTGRQTNANRPLIESQVMPTSAANAFQSGIERMKARDYEHAIPHFRQFVADGGLAGLGLVQEAECLFYLKRYDDALALCDQVRRQDTGTPSAARAFLIRSKVFEVRGEMARSEIELYEAARHGDWVAQLKISARPH